MGKTFLHSGARGDIIYGLPAIKALGGGTLLIRLAAKCYKSRPMDEKDLSLFRELLQGQDYIEGVEKWEMGVGVDYDMDKFRDIITEGRLLSECQLAAFNTTFDLSKPWIDSSVIEPICVADILVNRTQRYHGPFDWSEIRDWQSRCVFTGMPEEYDEFRQTTGLDKIPFRQAESYRQLAGMILGSKVFIGNQSFAFSLAEAMKHPRILEIHLADPNCMPQSDNGFTRLTQNILRHLVFGEQLIPEKKMSYKSFFPTRIGNATKAVKKPAVSYVIPVKQQAHIPSIFVEKVKKGDSEVIIVDDQDTFEKGANKGAEQSVGRVICVVSPEYAHYATARVVVALLDKNDGLAGTNMKANAYPYATGPCIAVSRKAYEQCGLFNPVMQSGELNYLEINLRYAKRRYPCKSANISCSFKSAPDTSGNAEYIRKVYGTTL